MHDMREVFCRFRLAMELLASVISHAYDSQIGMARPHVFTIM
jgi:hypothetical protein